MGWPHQVVQLLRFFAKIKAAILEKLWYNQSCIGWQTNASKTSFFEHIASIIEPYLKRYQTDKPMIPFMYYDLKDIIYQFLEMIMKPAVFHSFMAKP